MSKSLNAVQLIGNLGSDPEVRSLTSGSKVANFSIATTRQWKNGKDEKQEKTEWHRCIAWSQPNKQGLADIVEKYVKKGDRVYVAGRIEYRTYEDKEGVTKFSTEIVVDDVILLGSKNESAKATPAAPAAKKSESLDDFPAALANDDDIPLPF